MTNERTLGIRKASLYSHFANKQDILDSVIETVLKGYADHSMFVRADWDDPEFTKDKTGMTAEDVAKLIQGQLRYIMHDPHISKGRKMLMIEQFRNVELAELQTKQNYRMLERKHGLFDSGEYDYRFDGARESGRPNGVTGAPVPRKRRSNICIQRPDMTCALTAAKKSLQLLQK